MWKNVRAARVGVALALVAFIAACSFTRFGYNQADTIAAWMANDYFDLDPQQKYEFEKRFERFYAWHRHEQLPEYAGFMRTARAKLKQGITREDVLWFVDGLRTRYRAAMRHAAPDAAALLATLTPAQVEHLQRQWDKANAKWAKEHKINGTPAERQEAEAKRVIKSFKEWLAPLDADQEQRVIALVRDLPPIEQVRLAERQRRQQAFVDLLAHRSEDRNRFAARVTDWLVNWDKARSAEEQKRLDAWWTRRADVFVALDRTMSAEQREIAMQRLQSYVNDFTQLAVR